MDKYTKGKNVEEPLEKNKIPIKDLPEDFLWMQVNPGTKMRNVLDLAIKEMKTRDTVVWSGSGPAVGKVISCVEIMKRQFRSLHQVNKICFRKVKEYWDPLLEDLDPLVVVRELPTIHILLSKTPVDNTQTGYQAPPGNNSERKHIPKQENKPQRKRIDADKFESLGLRSFRTKNYKRKPQEHKGNVNKPSGALPTERSEGNSRSSPQVRGTDPGPSGVG